MFNKAMTGGACNADGTQSGINQNPLTNMMDKLIMGDARARQAAEGFYDPLAQAQAQEMRLLEEQFAMMQNKEMMEKMFGDIQKQQQFQHFAHLQGQQNADLNSIWDSQAMPQQMNSQQQTFQQPWMGPLNMRQGMMGAPIYQPSQQLVEQTQQVIQQQKEEVKEAKEETNIKEVTGNMVEALSNSDNPKHRNCKFLKFLNKLNYGAYKLENEQLVKDPVKLKEFREIETERRTQDMLREVNKVNQLEETKDVEEVIDTQQSKFKNILEGDEEVTMEKYNEMMQEWMKGGAEMENMNRLMEEWGKTWDEDYQLQMPNDPNVINYAKENKYLGSQINRLEHAKKLIDEQKSQEAILCLEAEVQENRENSEAWRILGQLYQENDQDNFAIISLREAHAADPYDLDSLLALGVSCTNENDRLDAYKYLHLWLKYHPDFNSLPGVQENEQLEYDQIKAAFEMAHLQKPVDTQVLLALGVLSFIQANFEQAGAYFLKGIQENPTDHSLWNKYGAAFSQQLKTREAIEAYQQALDLRPNYARCIINIGLAQNNCADYFSSANSLMNGLVLNPRLDHVRVYLKQAFLQMNRFDLVEKLELNDFNLFKPEFSLMDPTQLPKPNLERLYTNPLFFQQI